MKKRQKDFEKAWRQMVDLGARRAAPRDDQACKVLRSGNKGGMSKDKQVAQRMDEIFDVVNERDEVTGQATRAEVHRRGLWHRAVHVVVFNRSGDLFLQKRSMAKDMSPGCWDSSCSGHVDSGETYLTAAVRELGEEIGLRGNSPEALQPWFKVEACADTGWEFMWIYGLQHEGPFELHPAEIETGRWWKREEVDAEISGAPSKFTRPFRYLWPRMMEKLRNGK